MDMDDITGARIKKQRKKLNLSVDELAAAVGKGPATIYRYERYDYDRIPPEIIPVLAKHLKVSTAYLLRQTDIPGDFTSELGALNITNLRTRLKVFKETGVVVVNNRDEAASMLCKQYLKRKRFISEFNKHFESLTEDELQTVLDFMGYLASKHQDQPTT